MSLEFNSSTVPAFLTKLWYLVEDPSTNDLICWDGSGKSFHVLDQIRFAREILPLYFKHNNIASFIRQLNMYGFRKVLNTDALNLKTEKEDLTFAHQFFARGQEHLLDMIKRKTATQSQSLASLSKKDVSHIFGEVSSLKTQLDSMTETLENLKVENEVLWKEVVTLRQKHARQQEVVSKLVHFFISFVNKDRSRGTIKRKLPLMIKGPSDDGNQIQMDKVVAVSKNPQKDSNAITQENLTNTNTNSTSRYLTFDSPDKQLEPLALGFDPQHSLELTDLFDDELKTPNGDGDVMTKILSKHHLSSDTQSCSNELVSICEPRLSYRDFDKEEFSRNLNSFQNSIDSCCDSLSNSQYGVDAATLLGVSGDVCEKHERHSYLPSFQYQSDQGVGNAEDEGVLPAKRTKLIDDSAGKEVIQYIPQDGLGFSWDDLVPGLSISNNLQKLDDMDSFTTLELEGMEPSQCWSPSDSDKII